MRRRLILWRPKALTTKTNRWPHAVLARVSLGYSPPKGRSPTCYSPVRRSLPKQCARLACVRPAASVRSEPGSNSPVQSKCSIFCKYQRFKTHNRLHVRPRDSRNRRLGSNLMVLTTHTFYLDFKDRPESTDRNPFLRSVCVRRKRSSFPRTGPTSTTLSGIEVWESVSPSARLV